MRTLVERLTRQIVLTRTLHVNGQRRRIVVSPDARLAYLKPGKAGFDWRLVELAHRFARAGTVVWDIGANVGLFSVAATAYGARAIAVEADIWLAGLLRRTAQLNDDRITVVPSAVADQCGTVHLAIARRARASNAIAGYGRRQTGGVRHVETVASLTMDALSDSQPKPDFVKVDVEGAENLVFASAHKVLAHGPPVMTEMHPKNRPFVTKVFEAHGYRAHWPDGRPLDDSHTPEILFLREHTA
ncbi:MAG: FkbM family methyltransferase [Pseudomonadota bacterium]